MRLRPDGSKRPSKREKKRDSLGSPNKSESSKKKSNSAFDKSKREEKPRKGSGLRPLRGRRVSSSSEALVSRLSSTYRAASASSSPATKRER